MSTLTVPQQKAINRIVQRARNDVRSKYSSGWPHFHGGSVQKLGMHSLVHTDHVRRDAKIIGRAMGLDSDELLVVDVAAAPHDVVQLLGDGRNEAASQEWLRKEFRRESVLEGNTTAQDAAIFGIEATRVIRVGYMPTGQYFSRLKYPTLLAKKVSFCTAAGDFGDFYTPLGVLVGALFYCELQKVNPDQTPPLKDFDRFFAGQVKIAQTWKFPGDSQLLSSGKVENLLAPRRGEVTRYYEKTYALWTAGKIDGWQGLINRAIDFMHGRVKV